MSQATERLIEQLAGDARPVRRLRPPLLRAALWLAAVAVLSVVAVLWLANLQRFESRISDPATAVEMLAALATGVLAVIAAFHLSLPDRSQAWMLVPLPMLAVWIASSGYGCYEFVIRAGADGWAWGNAVACLRFILVVSLPLGLSLLLVLRRANPIAPLPVAATAGLGVAALAAALLEFFHPFEVTVLDLAAHFIAVAIVVSASSLTSRLRTAQ
jgi:hypothetical protein